MNHYIYTHPMFIEDVKKIGKAVLNSYSPQWTPKIIVGLSRGGLLPALYLSHMLKLPMKPIELSLRDFTSAPKREDLKVFDDDVLIVDDIFDTGATITQILQYKNAFEAGLFPHERKIAKVAVLVHNTSCILSPPDFIGSKITKDEHGHPWVIFEYEDIKI